MRECKQWAEKANCFLHHRYLAGLKLTDGAAHVTDYSNAARTMLDNIKDLNGMMRFWKNP